MADKQAFKPQGIAQSTQALADCAPQGRVFDAKNLGNTNFRKFIKAFAREQVRYESSIFDLINSYIPNFTNSYIEEWERELGIPDDCFNSVDFSDDERRRNIIIKLAFLTLVTPVDYIDLATILGLPIVVRGGTDLSRFPLTFPAVFGGQFAIIIEIDNDQPEVFPYTFPITFGDPKSALFECLVQRYKQAYVEVIFAYNSMTDGVPLLDGNGDVLLNGDGDVILVPA